MIARPPVRLTGVPSRRALPGWLRLLCTVWILSGLAVSGWSHPFLQNTWSVLVKSNRLQMRVTGTVREVAVTQGVDPGAGPGSLDTVLRALPGHAEYLLEHLDVRAGGVELEGTCLDYQLLSEAAPEPDDVPDPMSDFERTRVGFDFEYHVPGGALPARLQLAHRVLSGHPYAPGIPWDVTYAVEVRDDGRTVLARDVLRGGALLEVPTGVEGSTKPEPASPDGGPVGLPGTAAYLRLGVHHVLTGYDHLLFLMALALAARGAADLFRILLVFTAAHSITVTVAALGWVRAPDWLVEPVIAGSIVIVALQNVLAPGHAKGPGRLGLAFGFGLVHGLGFAGGLSDSLGPAAGIGLARAIAAFCVGVELGHLAVAAPVFGILEGIRRGREDRVAPSLLRWGSLAVAAGGAYFLWAALRAAV